jgi:tetratricopeptide (TPR) repeat protein
VSHIPKAGLATYALMPDELPAEEAKRIAAHLAECAACQQTADFFAVSESVLEAELRDPATWEPVDGSATQRALAEYSELVAEEDREAAEMLASYVRNPVNAAWETLAVRRRFRTGGVVRGLLSAAVAVREDDPLAALTFADNAIAIAERLDDDRYPSSAVDQLTANAWKECANAQMFLGRFADALRSLDSAERFHRRYRPNGLGLSSVALVRAGVFYEQGRLDEAMALAERAEVGFAHAGEERRRIDALFLRGGILFEAGRAAEALPLFQQIIDYGENVGNLSLIARGSYAKGDCEVALGNLGEASVYFRRALVLLREVGPDLDRLKTEWGIARVLLAGGKYAEAIRHLRDVSTQFEKRQMVTDAALVGLDIIEALLAVGQKRRIVALAQHLFSVFTSAGKLTGALSAFAYLKEMAATDELKVRDLTEIRSFLRRAEVQPHLVFVPPADSV